MNLSTIRSIAKIGGEQYKRFKNDILEERSKSIHLAIKKNMFYLLKSPKAKYTSNDSQLTSHTQVSFTRGQSLIF